MSRLTVCIAGGLLQEAANKQRQIAARFKYPFIRSSQVNIRRLTSDAIIASMHEELVRAMAGAKVYDLAHTYRIGMPHHPVHPPYLFDW